MENTVHQQASPQKFCVFMIFLQDIPGPYTDEKVHMYKALHGCKLEEAVLMHSRGWHSSLRPPMLQVKNSSQKLAEVQHCSSVMSGICSTKPLVGAAPDRAGLGLPALAPPPALCSLGVGLGAFSYLLLLTVDNAASCSDMQCCICQVCSRTIPTKYLILMCYEDLETVQ